MTQFRIEVYADTYPTTFEITATNEGMAFKSAYNEWRKRFKGRRLSVNSMKILGRVKV